MRQRSGHVGEAIGYPAPRQTGPDTHLRVIRTQAKTETCVLGKKRGWRTHSEEDQRLQRDPAVAGLKGETEATGSQGAPHREVSGSPQQRGRENND